MAISHTQLANAFLRGRQAAADRIPINPYQNNPTMKSYFENGLQAQLSGELPPPPPRPPQIPTIRRSIPRWKLHRSPTLTSKGDSHAL